MTRWGLRPLRAKEYSIQGIKTPLPQLGSSGDVALMENEEPDGEEKGGPTGLEAGIINALPVAFLILVTRGAIVSKINVTPKGCYLPILKRHSIFSVANLFAHNNTSQICYCGQISSQSSAVN